MNFILICWHESFTSIRNNKNHDISTFLKLQIDKFQYYSTEVEMAYASQYLMTEKLVMILRILIVVHFANVIIGLAVLILPR